MRSVTLSRIAVALSSLAALSAFAQVPARFGYQGRLLKADGNPETGVVSFKFALFATATGGAELWTETQQLGLTDGYYSTFLGEVSAVPASVFDGSERFLELTINATALTPRQRINSVAYAVRAALARDVAGGGTVDTSSLSIGGTTVINGTGQVVPAALGPLGLVGTAGTINTANNPVDWSKLKNVPLGFADGVDDGLTGVTAGPGLSLTASTTSPALAVIFGSATGTVTQGNDPRLSDARQPTAGSGLYINNGSTPQAAGFNVAGSARVGQLDVNGPGGNVPHECTQRSTVFGGASGGVSCLSGEIVVGGGGSCDASGLRGSRPAGAQWLVDCMVAGVANTATAICCRY